ncbi:hypothetical protein QZH41_002917 [Actinostola sp. cb2023]|nr:hypothetical protein QZH41_002917 [Actinostola sp. cb2023]
MKKKVMMRITKDIFFVLRRHRCAHRPASRVTSQKCVFTEYQDRYKKHGSTSRTQPIKPEFSVKASTDPFDGNTNYKYDYIPHKLDPPKKREKERYVRPDGRVEDESTYRHDYPGRIMAPAVSAKPPVNYQASTRPFGGTTVHQDTFKQWDLGDCKVKSMKPLASTMGNNGRMDGRTIQQTDFPGHYVARRPAIRPLNSEFRTPHGPMESDTTTRLDYKAKQAVPACSAKPIERRPTTGPPFDGMTTFQHDYQMKRGLPAASFKPVQEAIQSNAPFQDETTTGFSYRKWDIPKRQPKEKEMYRPPSGKFKDDTTFKHDYPQWNVGPAVSAKPPLQSFACNQPFQDRTTHGDTYRAWDFQPVPKSTKTDGYRPPSGRFEGESTMQSHYRGQLGVPAKPIRHETNRPLSASPMDLNTTYGDTFRGERPQFTF